MSAHKRYRAYIFFPGPRSLWRTARKFVPAQNGDIPVMRGEYTPDPAEIIVERSFRFLAMAKGWCRVHLRRLRNVNAEIHDSTVDG